MTMRKMSGNDFDSLVSFFDEMAQTNWLSTIHDQLKSLSGSWENKTVVDVGCGTGRLLYRGLEEANQLIGIDLSEQMVVAAEGLLRSPEMKAKIEVVVGDAYNLPLKESSVDVALSTCVMFLLPEPEKGLIELKRVLCSNGVLAMLNPAPEMNPSRARAYANDHQINGFELESLLAWSNVSTKRHRYTNEELTKLLNTIGFTNIKHVQVLSGLATITIALNV
nr:class I SAM-dependent methyltransferase [Bacillus suaedae]